MKIENKPSCMKELAICLLPELLMSIVMECHNKAHFLKMIKNSIDMKYLKTFGRVQNQRALIS